MKNVITVVLASSAFMAVTAFANQGLELAKSKQCLTCHAVQGPGTGNDVPSFQSIADKYKGREKFDGLLISQIIGSPPQNKYHWGTREMVSPAARPNVDVVEANQLLDWIFSLKKK